MIYLDHNASAPLLPPARAAWLEAEEKFPGNPSSPHRLGARAENALEQAAQRLAAKLGCSPLDLVWTSGATEACNTVLQHVAAAVGSGMGVSPMITGGTPVPPSICVSAIEHPGVLESARHFFGTRVELIPVSREGVANLDWLRDRLRQTRPALVAIMAANNETGVLQPWRQARELCAETGVPFFCDATQWCGRLPSSGLGDCDFVAGSAHKFGGPRGVGFLKVGGRAALRPLIRGGKQQEGRRAGTQNVAGVLAMLAALEWCERQIASGGPAERQMSRDRFVAELRTAVPGVQLNGAGADRLWNTVNVLMPEADCRQRWVVKLDKAGFAISTGSACASGSEEPSHVLTAMGLTANEAARALRFSGGWLTTEQEWRELGQAIIRIQRELSVPAV